MSKSGIHYMALDDVKQRLAKTDGEYKAASAQLDEAIKMGDLRENSEYDAAKTAVAKIVQLRDELTPALGMPVIRSNDNIRVIEEGSVLELIVWCVTQYPVATDSSEFAQYKTEEPKFRSKVMFGGTLDIHELLVDKALSSKTAIGQFILGKPSGDYSVPVPAGFANITVTKLNSDTSHDELYCELLQ